LYPLFDFSAEEAAAVIDMIDSVAEQHKEKTGSRLFFAADEFYLKAKRPIPPADYYEGYPQIENGVGMLRSFFEEFGIASEDAEELSSLGSPRRVSVATGVAAYDTVLKMAKAAESLSDKLEVSVICIKNRFFGESITVSGLLTGKDISEQLRGLDLGDELLIPKNALRAEEMDFLCGMKLSELSEILSVPIRPIGEDGFEFFDALFGR
jgi:NifB/MoaA-like Fe-S oxidoreductase